MNESWHLQDLEWLAELTPNEREKLRASAVRRAYEAGEVVFMPNPHPTSVYVLESGLVRIYRLSEEGVETTLGYVRPGEIFGELAVFGEYSRDSFAQAVDPSYVSKIPRQTVQPFVTSHPGFVAEIAKQIGERLKRTEDRVESLAHRDVQSRVLLILLEIAESFGVRRNDGTVELDVHVTQSDLASLVGSTRQTVNASLGELSDQGLVRREGRRIVLLDVERMRRIGHPNR